jgi:hypothetical protein
MFDPNVLLRPPPGLAEIINNYASHGSLQNDRTLSPQLPPQRLDTHPNATTYTPTDPSYYQQPTSGMGSLFRNGISLSRPPLNPNTPPANPANPPTPGIICLNLNQNAAPGNPGDPGNPGGGGPGDNGF